MCPAAPLVGGRTGRARFSGGWRSARKAAGSVSAMDAPTGEPVGGITGTRFGRCSGAPKSETAWCDHFVTTTRLAVNSLVPKSPTTRVNLISSPASLPE
jgi:hypothetical protein